jgi:hypothetical protein
MGVDGVVILEPSVDLLEDGDGVGAGFTRM